MIGTSRAGDLMYIAIIVPRVSVYCRCVSSIWIFLSSSLRLRRVRIGTETRYLLEYIPHLLCECAVCLVCRYVGTYSTYPCNAASVCTLYVPAGRFTALSYSTLTTSYIYQNSLRTLYIQSKVLFGPKLKPPEVFAARYRRTRVLPVPRPAPVKQEYFCCNITKRLGVTITEYYFQLCDSPIHRYAG